MKSVQIRSFFWFVFSPNVEKYGLEKTPYLDAFYTMIIQPLIQEVLLMEKIL